MIKVNAWWLALMALRHPDNFYDCQAMCDFLGAGSVPVHGSLALVPLRQTLDLCQGFY
ncbi:hypothetical protein OK016_12575 [Vibrio chagasii]|nr:hypothetical protein [Vibrio chagasii]